MQERSKHGIHQKVPVKSRTTNFRPARQFRYCTGANKTGARIKIKIQQALQSPVLSTVIRNVARISIVVPVAVAHAVH